MSHFKVMTTLETTVAAATVSGPPLQVRSQAGGVMAEFTEKWVRGRCTVST